MKFLAKICVTPKAAILDPQGKTVASSLHSLGYDEVGDVRLGKYLELRLESSDAGTAAGRVDEMCRRLLANEVIEDYQFDLEEDAA